MALQAQQAAIRRVLESMLTSAKALKPRAKKGPSAYILFTSAKRSQLDELDANFKAMEAKEKMKHLAGLWNELGESEKVKYKAEAAAAAASAAKAAPAATATLEADELTFPLQVKNDAALKKLTKELAAEATAALVAELREGKAISLSGTGKLTPAKADEDGSFAIKFKPAKGK